jgi:hypothetical protein
MGGNAKTSAIIGLIVSLAMFASSRANEADLEWSTFLGGGGDDKGFGMVMDDSTNVYVTGYSESSDFPTTYGAYDTTYNDTSDVFVAKINSTGDALIYATFIGGSGIDQGRGIALDDSKNIYVIGRTASTDFPTTPEALDTTHNGLLDVFVVKLSPTGNTLIYATFLGGSGNDYANGITLDDDGHAALTGWTNSSDFPTTYGAFDTTYNFGGAVGNDAFVAKLNAAGTDLDYSSYLGGNHDDCCFCLSVDGSGSVYLGGTAWSTDFPVTSGAFDTSHDDSRDAFVIKLNPTGSDLIYSTFLGGSGDEYVMSIVVDDSGAVSLTGATYSQNFPTTAGAYDTDHDAGTDVFLTELNATGTALLFSTFLGGGDSDISTDMVIDSLGYIYVTGYTYGFNGTFPTTPDAYDRTHNGNWDAFFSKFDPTASDLVYSTFLGGQDEDEGYAIAVDDSGSIYLVGYTESADFPSTQGAVDETPNGGFDVFVSRVKIHSDTTSPEAIADLSCDVENLTKGADIRLNWSQPYDDVGVARYVVYRSSSASALGDSLAGSTDTTYLDSGAAGDVDTNFCYTVKAVDAAGNESGESNTVGEHDWDLATTTGTDYTWMALALDDSGLTMASDLEADIEAHSHPATNCLTISQWNPTAQTYTHYTTVPIPMGDFALAPGGAYRVEVNAGAVYTQVGQVLPADSLTFQLTTTTGTDYTWISLPLHLDSLAMASDLEADIEAHSHPATNCLTISQWNPTAQTYTHYTTVPIPMGDFALAPGGAYRVEVTADAVWPSSSKATKAFQRTLRSR